MSRLLLAPVLAVTLLCACSTTSFVSTWKDPEVRAGALHGKTVATIYVTKDVNLRRSAEVYVANDLTNRGIKGVTLVHPAGGATVAMARRPARRSRPQVSMRPS